MTNIRKTIFSDDKMKTFDQFFVGFDDVIDNIARHHETLSKTSSYYPPYNIRKTNDTTYIIELAVAGFTKNDIDIELKDNILTVKNIHKETQSQDIYLHRGIAKRDFKRTFALDGQVEVQGAELQDGMLEITLVRIIPDHKKPKKIEIKSREQLTQVERQLLV